MAHCLFFRLQMLPYLLNPPKILMIEEPENGIHPQAIEAVLQGLFSMHNTQVLVSSHSPVVVAHIPLEQLLTTRLKRDGAVEIVHGKEHPRLKNWKNEIDLGTLFAAGILG